MINRSTTFFLLRLLLSCVFVHTTNNQQRCRSTRCAAKPPFESDKRGLQLRNKVSSSCNNADRPDVNKQNANSKRMPTCCHRATRQRNYNCSSQQQVPMIMSLSNQKKKIVFPFFFMTRCCCCKGRRGLVLFGLLVELLTTSTILHTCSPACIMRQWKRDGRRYRCKANPKGTVKRLLL